MGLAVKLHRSIDRSVGVCGANIPWLRRSRNSGWFSRLLSPADGCLRAAAHQAENPSVRQTPQTSWALEIRRKIITRTRHAPTLPNLTAASLTATFHYFQVL